MRIHKFQTTDAFIAIDLEGAEASSGPVRWAKKILQGGAKDLARTQTYTYAALGMQRGGASAGISAPPDTRGEAITAFVEEAGALVADGTYLPDAAKGIGDPELDGLRGDDPRDHARLGTFGERCDGLSAAVTAHHAVGLDGKTVAIEGFEGIGRWIAAAAVERGARVTAVSTATGSVANDDGFALADLDAAVAEHGADAVNELGEVGAAKAVFGSGAEVVFAGSKTGIVDHVVAGQLTDSAAVIAAGRLHLTARGLAVLRKAGVAAPADFVSLAGSTLAAWGDPNRSDDEIFAGIREDIGDLSDELAEHEDGLLLAACYHGESFLQTWQSELPFGRPLAP
ncbi:MAG: hypothetical protein AAGA90_01665 [Actinomycetota bacterium]